MEVKRLKPEERERVLLSLERPASCNSSVYGIQLLGHALLSIFQMRNPRLWTVTQMGSGRIKTHLQICWASPSAPTNLGLEDRPWVCASEARMVGSSWCQDPSMTSEDTEASPDRWQIPVIGTLGIVVWWWFERLCVGLERMGITIRQFYLFNGSRCGKKAVTLSF